MAEAYRSEAGHIHLEPAMEGGATERAIDLAHLARQTLGDHALEAEILELFVKQSRNLCGRIEAAGDARQRNDLAHTLKGSARAVGAWHVARDAERIEEAGEDRQLAAALVLLAASVEEAITAIKAMPVR